MSRVVYLCFPTSNRNQLSFSMRPLLLYIFVFLHQTATAPSTTATNSRCISLFSYIKPQPPVVVVLALRVVYLCFPTSNRNLLIGHCGGDVVVYLCFPTSNRNRVCECPTARSVVYLCFPLGCISLFSYIKPQLGETTTGSHTVVYLCFPTSNRNLRVWRTRLITLYIFVFLHQTATCGCWCSIVPLVVYLCFPTSNRNSASTRMYISLLYIFVFLHQTATCQPIDRHCLCCISLFSYIKPQPSVWSSLTCGGCISLFSYIKPQLIL